MRFLFDHDVPDDLAHVLRHLGHTVVLLREALHTTAIDPDVLAHANLSRMILITCNRDHFIALARTQPHCGIIVVDAYKESHRRARCPRAPARECGGTGTRKQHQLRLNHPARVRETKPPQQAHRARE